MINKKSLLITVGFVLFGGFFETILYLLYQNKLINTELLGSNIVIFLVMVIAAVCYLILSFKAYNNKSTYLDFLIHFLIYGVVYLFFILTYKYSCVPLLKSSTSTLLMICVFLVCFYHLYYVFNQKYTANLLSIKNQRVTPGIKWHKIIIYWANMVFFGFVIMCIANLFFPLFNSLLI